MRKILRKIIQILDGTPAVYGKRQRGQSVLEMAFITPLLIVLIAGTIEVGWFTNNYLILMEVTRVGARRATVLEGDDSPLGWERDAFKMSGMVTSGTTAYNDDHSCSGVGSNLNPDPIGFYNLIACLMEKSMDPLVLNRTNGEDDIIISAFSIQTFLPADVADVQSLHPSDPAVSGPSPVPLNRAVVVGRYPSNANECAPQGTRDPFDYYHTGVFDPIDPFDAQPNLTSRRELDGYDTTPELQVGYTYTNQHEITNNPTCTGSEFTVAQIEGLFNLNNFGLNNNTRAYMPAYGVTLAEVYWQHHLLLQFPAFSPLFRALGNQTVVHVWAAFPTPSIEPHIRFD